MHVEKYLSELISNLVAYRSENSLVRDSIVAVSLGSTAGGITTRDACKTLKKFSGLNIPDVTSIIRVATASTAVPAVGGSTHVGESIGDGSFSSVPSIPAIDETANGAGLGIGSIISKKKAAAGSQPAVVLLPPKQPKKRGRPSNKDRGLPPPPKKQQH